jgi:hypothetical protein
LRDKDLDNLYGCKAISKVQFLIEINIIFLSFKSSVFGHETLNRDPHPEFRLIDYVYVTPYSSLDKNKCLVFKRLFSSFQTPVHSV